MTWPNCCYGNRQHTKLEILSEIFATMMALSDRNIFVVIYKHVNFFHFSFFSNVYYVIIAGMP